MAASSILKHRVTEFFDNPKSIPAIIVQAFIMLLIVATGVDFFIEFFRPEYYEAHAAFMHGLEIIVVVAFTLEYVLRFWASSSRGKFVIDIFNIIDLLAIAPFYLHVANFSLLRGARIIRLLRLMRLLRLAKFMKYSKKAHMSITHILQENVIKNLLVILVIIFFYEPIQHFLSEVDPAIYPDIIFATSILALAAMFGAFSFSYENTNPYSPGDRLFAHLTSAFLMVPIGIMFIFILVSIDHQLHAKPYVLMATTWFVYFSLILWDFGNVKKIERNLEEKR